MPNKRAWTDDELRAAVASSTTYLMVLKALRLSGRGGSHYNVKKRVIELGLDTGHFTSAPNDYRRSWTEDELRQAVAACTSFIEVIAALGLHPANGVEGKIRRDVKALGLRTAHFRKGKSRWTDEQLRAAVTSSRSYAQAIKALGLIAAGGNYDQVQRRIGELSLDTSHFTGAGWSAGMKFGPRPTRSLHELLVKGSSVSTNHLKERLFREGLKTAACEICGWAVARECDGRIPVELDHMNGDKSDNRLENLRVLCPNCHALQPTHRGLNRKLKRRRVGEEGSHATVSPSAP